jgi:hypothetical protein
VTSSVAPLSRASFSDVARLGRLVRGIRRRCWVIFRSSFEITFNDGTRSRSESESAKLSPIQLNSALLDVFSNGKTITVSVPCACAPTANIAVIKNRYKYFLNIDLYKICTVQKPAYILSESAKVQMLNR